MRVCIDGGVRVSSLFLYSVAHLVVCSARRQLIIDTDAGFDVDDVGAICVANALADAGEVELLALAHTNAFSRGIGAVSALMTWYGRGHVPLGAYKGPWARDPAAGSHPRHTADRYVSDLAQNFAARVRNSSGVPAAVDVYRRALAAAPDGSVHIASIGITTNMRDLLRSAPDAHSALGGRALVARKVKQIVWMDGEYNFGCAQRDTKDWLGPDEGCRGSAKAAIEGWPPSVEQIFTNVGAGVLHGGSLAQCAPAGNPCRRAFEDWGHGVAKAGRFSWDPLAVLIAARGTARVGLEQGSSGYNTVSDDGKETWRHAAGEHGYNQSRVRFGDFQGHDPRELLGAELDRLLCKPPARRHTLLA